MVLLKINLVHQVLTVGQIEIEQLIIESLTEITTAIMVLVLPTTIEETHPVLIAPLP